MGIWTINQFIGTNVLPINRINRLKNSNTTTSWYHVMFYTQNRSFPSSLSANYIFFVILNLFCCNCYHDLNDNGLSININEGIFLFPLIIVYNFYIFSLIIVNSFQ